MQRQSISIALLLIASSVGAQTKQRLEAPFDVPPIQEEYGNPGRKVCDMGQCVWEDSDYSHPARLGEVLHRRLRTTCADKTRFLVIAENGSQHCLKLTGKGVRDAK